MSTQTPNFQDLFAKYADGANQALGDAADQFDPDNALISNGRRDAQLRYMVRATDAVSAGKTKLAAKLADKAFNIDPEDPTTNHMIASILTNLGKLSNAITFYERALKRDPDNHQIYRNISRLATRLDMADTAEKFARMALARCPDDISAVISLACLLRDKGRFDDAIDLLRAKIYAAPENADYWNTLGTVLIEANDPVQAETFLSEALRINPRHAKAWHNLGYAKSQAGDAPAAVEAYTRAIALAKPGQDVQRMFHDRAAVNFATGNLSQGWEDYAARRHPDLQVAMRTATTIPLWDGEQSLLGQCVLIIGEQGIGDEVLFLNALADLQATLGPEGHLVIACERRLMPLISRSFPGADVGFHITIEQEGCKVRSVPFAQTLERQPDVFAYMGMACEAKRLSLKDFENKPAHFTADQDRVAAIKSQLDALGQGPKIGLCWKSKLMTASRSKHFSAFDGWEPVLRTSGATFVSMQYGDVEEELKLAEDRFGVTIHQIPDLDLMDDLDGVAAAGAALDLTLGPMNASTNLAGSVGGEVWFVMPKTHWPLFGQDRLVWYPNTRAFTIAQAGQWHDAMNAMADALADFVGQQRAA